MIVTKHSKPHIDKAVGLRDTPSGRAKHDRIYSRTARVMTSQPTRKRKGTKRTNRSAGSDLSHLAELGASKRSHRIFRDVMSFSWPVLVAIALQSIAYLAFYTRVTPDWPAAVTVLAVLALVPMASASTLSAFRRQEAPIIAAAVIVAIFFSFAITYLSAMRVRVTFAGFAAAMPLTMLIIAIGNIRFHQRLSARVALVAFEGDRIPLSLLGKANVAVISDPTTDVTPFDTILIDPEKHHKPEWSALLARCYLAGVDIVPWTRFLEIRQGRVHVPTFDVSHLAYTPSQMLYARAKRLLDVLAVIVTLPLTIPLAVLTAAYIYARDGSPVLFVQHRRGFAGRVFRMYKFRTMYSGTGGGSTMNGDKRIIPGGRFLRKCRLDELPQLYNILIGDMSLIGPRPVAEYVARSSIKYEEKYALRNLVLPGITGWAQVTSGYAETTEEEIEKLAYDLYYVKHLSFDLDLQILFKTVKTVLFGTGAR